MPSRLVPGLDPVPCVQCDRRESGLGWGEFCSACRAEQERGAGRIARRTALLGTAIIGAVLMLQGMPDLKTRLFGGASVLLTYVILRRIGFAIVVEHRRRKDMDAVRRRQS